MSDGRQGYGGASDDGGGQGDGNGPGGNDRDRVREQTNEHEAQRLRDQIKDRVTREAEARRKEREQAKDKQGGRSGHDNQHQKVSADADRSGHRDGAHDDPTQDGNGDKDRSRPGVDPDKKNSGRSNPFLRQDPHDRDRQSQRTDDHDQDRQQHDKKTDTKASKDHRTPSDEGGHGKPETTHEAHRDDSTRRTKHFDSARHDRASDHGSGSPSDTPSGGTSPNRAEQPEHSSPPGFDRIRADARPTSDHESTFLDVVRADMKSATDTGPTPLDKIRDNAKASDGTTPTPDFNKLRADAGTNRAPTLKEAGTESRTHAGDAQYPWLAAFKNHHGTVGEPRHSEPRGMPIPYEKAREHYTPKHLPQNEFIRGPREADRKPAAPSASAESPHETSVKAQGVLKAPETGSSSTGFDASPTKPEDTADLVKPHGQPLDGPIASAQGHNARPSGTAPGPSWAPPAGPAVTARFDRVRADATPTPDSGVPPITEHVHPARPESRPRPIAATHSDLLSPDHSHEAGPASAHGRPPILLDRPEAHADVGAYGTERPYQADHARGDEVLRRLRGTDHQSARSPTRSGTATSRWRDIVERLDERAPGLRYLFICANDDYGRAGERFLRWQYPGYRVVHVKSLEALVARVRADLATGARHGSSRRVAEIVVLAHANEHGVLKLSVTEDAAARSRRVGHVVRPTSPWELSVLASEIRAGRESTLARDRAQMIDAIDHDTRIVVRGCNFGRSDDGLQAVALFFGGRARVYAPKMIQGFELRRVDPEHSSEIFESLLRQGLRTPGSDATRPAVRRRAIGAITRANGGVIPGQFFVASDDTESFRLMSPRQRLSDNAESVKVRTPSPDPTIKDLFSRLPRGELERIARALTQEYRPEYGPLYQVMARAWSERRPGEKLAPIIGDPDEPLCGLPPSVFETTGADVAPVAAGAGDEDVWKSSVEAGFDPVHDGRDPFNDGVSRFAPPRTDQARRAAESNFGENSLNDSARVALVEPPFSRHGQFEALPSGGVRLWNFSVGGTDLSTEHQSALRTMIRAHGHAGSYDVTGYASTPGRRSTNQRLSTERAECVRDFLVAEGVPATNVAIHGLGETAPLESDVIAHRVDARRAAQNRRVEVQWSPSDPVALPHQLDPSTTQTLRAEILRRRPASPDTVDTALNWISLGSDIISDVAVFAVEGGAISVAGGAFGLVGPIVAFIQEVREDERWRESDRRGTEIVGLEVGMACARVLAADDRLASDITADDLVSVIREPNDVAVKYYFSADHIADDLIGVLDKRNVTLLSVDARAAAFRKGLDKVATVVNGVMRSADSTLRRAVDAQHLDATLAEERYLESGRRMRRRLANMLEKQTLEEIRRSR